jgi:hypothetical protein
MNDESNGEGKGWERARSVPLKSDKANILEAEDIRSIIALKDFSSYTVDDRERQF